MKKLLLIISLFFYTAFQLYASPALYAELSEFETFCKGWNYKAYNLKSSEYKDSTGILHSWTTGATTIAAEFNTSDFCVEVQYSAEGGTRFSKKEKGVFHQLNLFDKSKAKKRKKMFSDKTEYQYYDSYSGDYNGLLENSCYMKFWIKSTKFSPDIWK